MKSVFTARTLGTQHEISPGAAVIINSSKKSNSQRNTDSRNNAGWRGWRDWQRRAAGLRAQLGTIERGGSNDGGTAGGMTGGGSMDTNEAGAAGAGGHFDDIRK